MMKVPRVTAHDAIADPDLQDALCNWMRTEGLDPDSTFTIEFPAEGVVDVEEYVLTPTGARQVDPERPDSALRRWRRGVRVKTAPPRRVVGR